MLDAARTNLDAAGVADPIRAVVADAGYSNKKNRTRPAEGNNPILLVAVPRLGGKKPAEGQVRKTYPGRGDDPSRGRMTKRLANPAGSRLYAPQNHHRAGVWSDETARRAAGAASRPGQGQH
jgi:hypothetical protein